MCLEETLKDLGCEALLENLQQTWPQVALFGNKISLEIIIVTKSVSLDLILGIARKLNAVQNAAKNCWLGPHTFKKMIYYSHVNPYGLKPHNGWQLFYNWQDFQHSVLERIHHFQRSWSLHKYLGVMPDNTLESLLLDCWMEM